MSKNTDNSFSNFVTSLLISILIVFTIALCATCYVDLKNEDKDRSVCYQIKDDAECPTSCEKLAISYSNPALPCSCFKSANMLAKNVPFRCFNK